MPAKLRSSGIVSVGDVPWGTHFCHFYETPEDLLDILIPYFKAGLENNEFCMWIVCDPVTEVDGRQALRNAVPEFDRRLAPETSRSSRICSGISGRVSLHAFGRHRTQTGRTSASAPALHAGQSHRKCARSYLLQGSCQPVH